MWIHPSLPGRVGEEKRRIKIRKRIKSKSKRRIRNGWTDAA
jgi:hypothetical protein